MKLIIEIFPWVPFKNEQLLTMFEEISYKVLEIFIFESKRVKKIIDSKLILLFFFNII